MTSSAERTPRTAAPDRRRVLVVSRDRRLGVALAAPHLDVAVSPADRARRWVEVARAADVLVLDPGSPETALGAVRFLRGAGVGCPVLVLPTAAAGWEGVAAEPGVGLFAAPHSATTLETALAGLPKRAAPRAADPETAPAARPIAAARTAPTEPTEGTAAVDGAPPADGVAVRDPLAPAVLASLAGEPEPDLPADDDASLGALERSLRGRRPLSPVPPPQDRPHRTGPPVPAARPPGSGEVSPPAEAAAPAAADPGPAPAPQAPAAEPGASDPLDLVRALRAAAATLPMARAAAERIVEQALRRTHAETATLFVPDAEGWRVAAGFGLRPLEQRTVLPPEHWLVTAVARGHEAVLVEDTDIARQRLRGIPGASRAHLLAAPIPLVSGALVLSREAVPFSERDLTRTTTVLRHGAARLAAGLEVRGLARALLGHADLP